MKSVADVLDGFFAKSALPVLFAGAGISAKAGLPTWQNYLSSLASAAFEYDEYTKFFIERAVNDGALVDAATYYMLCRQIPEATKFRALVEPLEKFDAQELNSLVRLPFQSVVTTNFDRALFAAYAKYSGQAVQEVNIDDPTLDSAPFYTEKYIARIHGRIEVPGSMRLTKDAFAGLQSNNAYQHFLEHIFTRRQVLFIGFSFLDPAIESVLRAIRAFTRSTHRQEHVALVPLGAQAEFIARLEEHSIRRIEYPPDNNHDALWHGVQKYVETHGSASGTPVDVREQPFAVAKKYLATAFARARLAKQREPLAQAVAEGVVSGVIQASGDTGVLENELIRQLKDDLSLGGDAAATLVAQSVTALARGGMCRIETSNDANRYFSMQSGASPYDAAISRLTEGAIGRWTLLERGTDSTPARLFLNELFAQLLLTRGWDLGAAFAARRMPRDVDVAAAADGLKSDGLRPSVMVGLIRAVENLLLRPDDEEAEVLAELGRTAFGLELLLEAPHDPLFLRRTLPERIYFDANVIMPAITPGHPHFQLFNETIGSLREAAGTAILDVSLRVYEGFLNEIVSHKQRARQAMAQDNGEGALWEERSVGLYGSAGVNVFIGAYFNYIQDHLDVSFEEFLRTIAPYESEAELRIYLQKLGFQIVFDNQVHKRRSADILHTLEKFYANQLSENRKSGVVITHDASQLAVLDAELFEGVRTAFVTADRGIRSAMDSGDYSNVSNSMMTHLGLAQLVELLVGRLSASRGFASLLWMSHVSDDTTRIRNYLINLALREHDVALAMGMSEIVGEISEDAGMELSRKALRLDSEEPRDRTEMNRTLERYERDFFRKMNMEAEKILRRDG